MAVTLHWKNRLQTHQCFHKWGYLQIIHSSRIVPFKPSILGYPHLWKPDPRMLGPRGSLGNGALCPPWFPEASNILHGASWSAPLFSEFKQHFAYFQGGSFSDFSKDLIQFHTPSQKDVYQYIYINK